MPVILQVFLPLYQRNYQLVFLQVYQLMPQVLVLQLCQPSLIQHLQQVFRQFCLPLVQLGYQPKNLLHGQHKLLSMMTMILSPQLILQNLQLMVEQPVIMMIFLFHRRVVKNVQR